jgi:hypothetical protein
MTRKLLLLLLLLAGVYSLTALSPVHTAVTPKVGQVTIDNRHSKASDVVTLDNAIVGATHSIQTIPALTGAHIDAILCAQQSPACGTGARLYELGQDSHVNSDYALAFFWHESQFGKYGIAVRNRGLGNIRCTPGYSCLNGFRSYSSWVAGFADWYALIRYYIDTLHKSTIEQIVPTYAPTSENDTTAYIASVVTSVQVWRKNVVG